MKKYKVVVEASQEVEVWANDADEAAAEAVNEARDEVQPFWYVMQVREVQ